MSAPGPILSVRDVSHRYGARQALGAVSFDVRPGEVVGLLGPNGSGKSTLLGLLGGLMPLQSGDLDVAGAPLSRAGRAVMGFVFQSPSLDARLTARENLSLAARMRGLRGAVLAERVAAGLDAADLLDRADEPVGRLSGGMQRRLDIARATVHRPRLVIADEPTSGLDEASFQRTWRQLQQLVAEAGGSVLVTTHRPDEAERCDRLVLLDQGRVVAQDTPAGLISRVTDDRILLEGDDVAGLRDDVERLCGLPARADGARVVVEAPEGHALIVRIVEALPQGRLRGVTLRRPGLGEAFLALTGAALDAEPVALDEAA